MCLVVNNYGSIIYAGLGADVRQQLSYQSGWTTAGAVGNLIGKSLNSLDIHFPCQLRTSRCLDHGSYRPKAVDGARYRGCMICLAIETAMVAKYASPIAEIPNQAGLGAAVAML